MQNPFSQQKNSSNYKKEIYGGIANYLSVIYAVILAPILLNVNGHGIPISTSITATILSLFFMTLFAGLFIKLPIIIGPGFGAATIFSYSMVLQDHLSLPIALGMVFWSGLVFFIFSITNIRKNMIEAIPQNIKISLTVGIGFFFIILGLKNANVITANKNTLISFSPINTEMILCFLGLIILSVLSIKKKTYAYIFTIVIITLVSMLIGHSQIPKVFYSAPNFDLLFKADLIHSFNFKYIPLILILFIVVFLDGSSTLIGLTNQLNETSVELKSKYFKNALALDGVSGLFNSLLGSSSGAIYSESIVGIHSGARTGFASIITAILFLPLIFIAPIIAIIPNAAVSAVLIYVGILMAKQLKYLNFNDTEEMISSILTIIMMPLCFSISAGAVFGILSYTVLKLVLGKYKDINLYLTIVALLCSTWFFIY